MFLLASDPPGHPKLSLGYANRVSWEANFMMKWSPHSRVDRSELRTLGDQGVRNGKRVVG